MKRREFVRAAGQRRQRGRCRQRYRKLRGFLPMSFVTALLMSFVTAFMTVLMTHLMSWLTTGLTT
jgi:hypothetical protein